MVEELSEKERRREELEALVSRRGMVEDSAAAVSNAINLVVFAALVVDAVRVGRIGPDSFATEITLYTEGQPVRVNKAKYEHDELQALAYNNLIEALGTSAISTDTALDESLGPKDPAETDELNSARNIIYMVRCAFAHNPYSPTWRVAPKYRRQYSVPSIGVTFDGTTASDRPWRIEDYGGLLGHLNLLQFAKEEIEQRKPA